MAVRGGLAPFKAGIRRKVTDGDIDTLLRIPIRRISQYDIDQARKEMQEVRSRLKEIRSSLSRLKAYAAAFLQGLIEKYCDAYPRRTETVSIEQVDVREAAQRNLRLRYDRKTGYLGHQVGGSALLDVSPYDRVLVIRRTGAYSVHDVPEKLFVDKGMLFCGFVDKDRVYTAVYRDAGGYPFIKRCHIQKFILNKGYNLVPEGCRILKLTTESTQDIAVEYKPRPRVRILEESFRIEDYPIRGSRARGIRLAAREVQSVKFASKKGKATRR